MSPSELVMFAPFTNPHGVTLALQPLSTRDEEEEETDEKYTSLPKYKYHSWWILANPIYQFWFLNEYVSFRVFYCIMLACIGVVIFSQDSLLWKVLMYICISIDAIYGISLVILFTSPLRKKKILGLQGQMKLMLEVIETKPILEMKKWDLIASNLNSHLYIMNNWRNNDFFYDGKQCLNLFRFLIQPNIMIQIGVVDLELNNLNKAIEHARKVHTESIDNYWASQHPELF
ncbi:hypothetical protein TBLA_0E04350 [Henningerozyma blattae CBS 6284]|uniref:Uncharacterized protein n=1 Tax=Henningerozyma blattae (strain ATCC 34711 / CBS 6284 / DSM 70876 / NBRC 10599 / NRRL Y-10934 / UCD 77-7) TaxID=1071380 RepID=I2H537_HENB6|nr:hypothetical protein TBLA_0E04350 [Tetrapisispora blattae CBS 6284]CCH61489.1 hypothetical protein TBLA_0E04350 [Tetrapisispora blattae CBS 6284]